MTSYFILVTYIFVINDVIQNMKHRVRDLVNRYRFNHFVMNVNLRV